ncbi:MAG: hypothetical protein L0Y72_28835 [Gemmataceae bacterium]|nr:hypothetical protein [Gemmataceae bacterium]MCI0743054.1 hypothetical protein [Gemmataceae bacterium]
MDVVEAICITILAGGFLGAAVLVVLSAVRLRRAPHDRLVRFSYGWLATMGLLFGLCCCMGLVAALADRIASSPVALAVLIVVNFLAQPVAAVFIVGGISKLNLGLRGHVAVAWRRVPDEHLADTSPDERRWLARFCVFQGIIVLLFGMGLSYACAWPFLHWALA